MNKKKFIESIDPEYIIYLFISISLVAVLVYDLYAENFEDRISIWDSDPTLLIVILILICYSLIMMKLVAIQDIIGDKK